MENIVKKPEIYYKIQVLNPISMAWIDIQRAYNKIELAERAMPLGKQCRIMEVDGKKRTPVVSNARII